MEENFKGYKTQIHCPDCQEGYLRVLSGEEVVNMFPLSRGSHSVKNPEELKTQYFMGRDGEMHERWARPKYVTVYCDKCGHYHDMDERSVKITFENRKHKDVNKPNSIKIKGYGTHFMR